MPKIREKDIDPEIFENNDYRVEYRTPSSDSQYFSYKVLDKKSNAKSELKISVNEECYNLDGECQLTLIQENQKPMCLAALRPSLARRKGDTSYVEHPETEKYKNEPEIGGHRSLHSDGLYRYGKEINDVMSIYRALKKGDFEINSSARPTYSKEEAVEGVLNFMDNYIFNTDESKELLAKYMQEHPLSKQETNTPRVPVKKELNTHNCGTFWRNAQEMFNRFLHRGKERS